MSRTEMSVPACVRLALARAGRIWMGAPAAALSALATLGTQPAFSQEQESSGIEEVVVTARYREENLQQTPIAITAVSAEEITERAFNTSFEVGYIVPNASFRPAQAAFGNTMSAYLRGIGQYDFDFSTEPGVGIYIDDVYHPFTMGSQIDLLDLERVEVLRGPQGTLFGRGAIGGAVRYVSKKPQGDDTGFVSVTTGRYDRIDVRAGYDFTLVPEKLFARVTGVSKHRDGYQDVIDFACAFPSLAGNLKPVSPNLGKGCRIGTQGGEDVVGARGMLRFAPNETWDLTVTGEYADDSSEARADTLTTILPPPGGGPFGIWQSAYLVPKYGINYDSRFLPPNPFVTYATYSDPGSGLAFKPETALEKWSTSARLDIKLTDNISLATILAYQDIEGRFATDADGSPLNEQNVDGVQTIETRQAELRLSGRSWDRLEWTVGGFVYTGHALNTQTVSIPALSLFLDQILIGVPLATAVENLDSGDLVFVNARNDHKLKNVSGYAHAVYDLTDTLHIQAGIRYSDDEKLVDFNNTRVVRPGVEVLNTHTDWKFGVDYNLSQAQMVYGVVSTGYRPSSYNSRPFQATQVVSVDAEEATSYELGLKSDFFDRRLRTNLSGFKIDYETRILPVGGTECTLIPGTLDYALVPPGTPNAVTDSLGNTCLATVSRTFFANAPGDIKGIELEATFRPTDALTINGIYGLIDWKSPDLERCDFNLDGVPDPGATCISDRPPQVPEQNWSVGAAYEIGFQSGATLRPRVDVYGQSEICFSPASAASCEDGYELINATIEYVSAGAWTVALGATNLGNKQYFLNAFDLTLFGQPTVEKQPGHPREWFLTLRKDF